MRRKPTIISYQPPQELPEDEELVDIVTEPAADHMIMDRVNNAMTSSSPTTTTSSSRAAVVAESVHVEDSSQPSSALSRVDPDDPEARLTKPLVVYIDGPFGAPTSQIFRAQHAVLIGTGIGESK